MIKFNYTFYMDALLFNKVPYDIRKSFSNEDIGTIFAAFCDVIRDIENSYKNVTGNENFLDGMRDAIYSFLELELIGDGPESLRNSIEKAKAIEDKVEKCDQVALALSSYVRGELHDELVTHVDYWARGFVG